MRWLPWAQGDSDELTHDGLQLQNRAVIYTDSDQLLAMVIGAFRNG
jgi:hypothetical protein